MRMMIFYFICSAFSPGLAAAESAPVNVRGNLLIKAKGEVEVYHNSRKIVLRNKSDGQHYLVKIPGREFKAGDVIILHVNSPFVHRTISIAINLDDKAGQVPVKKSHWRFLGAGVDASKLTAADVLASQTLLISGHPDPKGESERIQLGMIPESRGGPDWVISAKKLNGWYCVGFVLTEEMLKKPLPALQ
jgi:hypothetical protein